MSKKEFTCRVCERTFVQGSSDEEALAEKEKLFPDVPIEECVLVCEDCFRLTMMAQPFQVAGG